MIKGSFLFLLIIMIAMLGAGCGSSQTIAVSANLSAGASQGKTVCESRCLRCHKVNGVGGMMASDISHVGSERDGAWLTKFLKDPKSVDPSNRMSTVPLKPDELKNLVEFLLTLK